MGVEAALVDRFARQLDGHARVLLHPVRLPEAGQPGAVGPEAVGRDDIRTLAQIILMDLAYQLRRISHSSRRPWTEPPISGHAFRDIDAAAL